MLKLYIQSTGHKSKVDTDLLARAFAALANHFADRNGRVNLGFVDDAASQALNRRYAGQDEPTDVLSFNYREGDQSVDGAELGDIAINLDAARRQAEQYGIAFDHELALLLVHGTLHLLGFDHQDKSRQTRMGSLQYSIMEDAGLNYRQFWT